MRVVHILVAFVVLIVGLFSAAQYLSMRREPAAPAATQVAEETETLVIPKALQPSQYERAHADVFLPERENEDLTPAERWARQQRVDESFVVHRDNARVDASQLSGQKRSAPTENEEPLSAVDTKRAEGRKNLEQAYRRLASSARELMRLVDDYERSCGTDTESYCGAKLERIGEQAARIGLVMDNAQEYARVSWLSPGELRDLRKRYGFENRMWDDLVRVVQQHRYKRRRR